MNIDIGEHFILPIYARDIESALKKKTTLIGEHADYIEMQPDGDVKEFIKNDLNSKGDGFMSNSRTYGLQSGITQPAEQLTSFDVLVKLGEYDTFLKELIPLLSIDRQASLTDALNANEKVIQLFEYINELYRTNAANAEVAALDEAGDA